VGCLARPTYLRPIDRLGDALPENVIAMPKGLHSQTTTIAEAPIARDLAV
jgi:hypothetical protein